MHPRLFLGLVLVSLCLPMPAQSSCQTQPAGHLTSVDELVSEIERRDLRFVFVGEHHAVGPVKRFTVDLVNGLIAGGTDVGLYVEGFRTDCAPGDTSCWSLARSFNPDAFQWLISESTAPVVAIDPPERDRRADRMATVIAAGTERVRVVLTGRSHVMHAGDPDADLWVYGGGMRFPNPGDLAESFPQAQILTIGLETSARTGASPYVVRTSGCGVDYVVTTPATADYWGADRRPPRASGPEPSPRLDLGARSAFDRASATTRPARVPRP